MGSFPSGPGNFKKLVANFDGSISSILASWSPLLSIHYTILRTRQIQAEVDPSAP